MITAADGTAFTSTVTVYVTGDNGTQAIGSVGSGVCTHEGNGFHSYEPAQAETNYDFIAFTFIGTGAIPSTVELFTSFPQTVDNSVAIATVDTNVDAILVDTNELQTNQGNWLTATGFSTHAPTDIVSAGAITTLAGAVVNVDTVDVTTTNTDMRGTDSAATATALATAQSDLDTITGSDGVTLATAQALYAPAKAGDSMDISSINSSTAAAIQLALSAATIVSGTAITGTLSTTAMTTDLTEATDDHFNGRIIIWTGGVLANQATNITDYTGLTKLLTFTAVTEAPSNTDPFVIV